MSPIRTLITDDHGAMRKALRSVLAGYQNIEVIGEATNGEEAIQQTASLHPDLIVMDIGMPILDGLSAAEVIKTCSPQTDILIFSMHRLKEFIESARAIGLNGFVCKDEGGAGLLRAIDALIRHQTYFPASSFP